VLKIRFMTIDDYSKVIELWKNTEGVEINEYDDSRKSIKRFLEKNSKTCFVAENSNHEIIGTIIGGNDGRRGLIYHLMVIPEYRNKGIGKKLLEKVEKNLKKDGIKKIYLLTLNDNEIGNEFWENNEYEIRDFLSLRTKKFN